MKTVIPDGAAAPAALDASNPIALSDREAYLAQLGTAPMAADAALAIAEIYRLDLEIAERRGALQVSKELLEGCEAALLLTAEGANAETRRAALQGLKLADADWLLHDAGCRAGVQAVAQAEAERDRQIRRYQTALTLLRLRTAQIAFLGGGDDHHEA